MATIAFGSTSAGQHYVTRAGARYQADPIGRVYNVNSATDVADLRASGGVVVLANYQSGIRRIADKLPLTSGVVANVASFQLPTGVWLLWGECWFDTSIGSSNVTWLAAAISQLSATFPTDPGDGETMSSIEPSSSGPSMTNSNVLTLSPLYLSIMEPLDLYLVCQANWGGSGSLYAYGKIAGLLQEG